MRFTACGTTRGRTSPLTRKPQLHRSSAASSCASPVTYRGTCPTSCSCLPAHGDGELGSWLAAGVESHSYLVKRERSATRVDCFASLHSLKFAPRKAAWRKQCLEVLRNLDGNARRRCRWTWPTARQWTCVHISLARCKPTHGTKYCTRKWRKTSARGAFKVPAQCPRGGLGGFRAQGRETPARARR